MAGSAAPSVGLAAVVRLGAASAELTSFCLCHSATSVPAEMTYQRLNLCWEPGGVTGVDVAIDFSGRLLGMRRGPTKSVLLWTASIHTFGLAEPIRVVRLSDEGVVEALDVVPRRRIHRRGGSGWILEMPVSVDPPERGTKVMALPCDDVRNSRPVRNADRQPR